MSETSFLNHLNEKKIKVSKLEWYVSKFFTKEKFILKHGEYLITKSNSLIDVLEKINNNNIFYRKFILIEGTNSIQLKKLIKAPGLIGKVPHLSEGKFKPDTYLYKWGDSKVSLLKKWKLNKIKLLNFIGEKERKQIY